MKRLLSCLCSMLLLFGVCLTANATPVFVDNVALDSGWSDVNKNYADDSLLCWAAAAANLLSYTGWTGTPNLSTASQIFNDYKKYWENKNGHTYNGAEWWFDGVNKKQGTAGWAQLTNTTHQGFYTQALYNSHMTYYDLGGNFENLILSLINEHHGLTLHVGWMYNGTRYGGHLLSIWGIDTAENYLYITDSNDQVTALQKYAYDEVTRYLTGYDNYAPVEAYLEDICALDIWQAGIDPNPTPRSGAEPVPEPSTVALLVLGLLGLFRIRKRK